MYVTLPDAPAVSTHAAPLPGRLVQTTTSSRRAETALFRAGDAATALYGIAAGVVRLSRVMENGRRQIIAFGYPGDVVGFPVAGRHTCDGDTLTPVRLVAYPARILDCPSLDPDLHAYLLDAALREIGGMQDHFLMLGRKSATERVASFLSVLARRAGRQVDGRLTLSLPMSRTDIADFLGLTTETVSRVLTHLRQCRVIGLETVHTVTVDSPDALDCIAEGR
ncbi:cyclic nucleotide-binding domain-containing protein [Rhodobacteraceae bacterium CCMM004]|nr:cyclic nucleotide-binding domain-containing protein [Rhodobacteraceae bacterium CCMM004]